MKIVRDKPPNYDQIAATFDLRPTTIFTYGSTIYAPTARLGWKPDYPLRQHEETHEIQQTLRGLSPESWWKRYIEDVDFRIEQEIEAYHNQYSVMSKADREKHIRRLAGDLSGPMYGNVLSYEQAKAAIRTGVRLQGGG